LIGIVCLPAPPIQADPSPRLNPLTVVVPSALSTPCKNRRFNWAEVLSKPSYTELAANSPRRARPKISTPASSLGVRRALLGATHCVKTNAHAARVLDCVVRPHQRDVHLMEAHIGGLAPSTTSMADSSGCMELPRQGRPLLLGEWSGSAHSDVQLLQGGPGNGNPTVPQPLETPSPQPSWTTIVRVHAVPRCPATDVVGGDEDNNGGDSSGSLQILGLLPPACFVKQLAVAKFSSPELHGSGCPSLEFVTPDIFSSHVPSHAHGTPTWGGGNVEPRRTHAELGGSAGGELLAIRILSKKLVVMNQYVPSTRARTWVVGHVLENYTCLSSGRDLYDADFGDTYGHQTVLVGDCEEVCTME
jgi:hypothetical protein